MFLSSLAQSVCAVLLAAGFPFFSGIRSLAAEPSPGLPDAPETDFRESGAAHLARLLSQSWASDWKAASLTGIRRVDPKPGQTFATGLPAVWHARITGPDGKTGYLMWEASGAGDLIEFAFDAPLRIDTPAARALDGVPPLQQFGLPDKDGTTIASGCVPTSAASVLGFWIATGHPAWQGSAGKDLLPDLTKRLRARLTMRAFPDKDGFTDDGMSLAGAMPEDLARGIQADAKAHHVPVTSQFHAFSFSTLQSEINAGRPVLLSCTVRVPHKPELSWGHEVAGTGWMTMDRSSFAGVLDNFLPVKHPATIRWIRTDAFDSLITIRPDHGNVPEKKPAKKQAPPD